MNNILLNKRVTSNNHILPFTADKAINVQLSQTDRWLNKELPATLTVDAGESHWVNRFVVKHISCLGWEDSYCMKSYELQVSNDNSEWKTIDSVQNNTQKITDKKFPVLLAQYFRLKITEGAEINPTLASIASFEVYEGPAPNSLTDIILTHGNLTPIFESKNLLYSVNVPFSLKTIQLTPKSADSNAKITINGQKIESASISQIIHLNLGDNLISVEVTPNLNDPFLAKLPKQIYVVHVNRMDSALLETFVLLDANNSVQLNPIFQPDVMNYTAIVDSITTSLNLLAMPINHEANIKVNGALVTKGQVTSAGMIYEGPNTINVTVITQTGLQQDYTIVVNRMYSLELQSLSLKSATYNYPLYLVSNVYDYSTSSGASNYTSVKIAPVAKSPNATVKVNNGLAISPTHLFETVLLSYGINYINIVVSNGGVSKTYHITIITPQ